MKKTTLMFFLTLGLIQTQAQDYLISFAGTGATTSVGSVKVDNLTRLTTITLSGTDILHLKSSLGIENPEIHNNSLQVYPNPMADESILTFITEENGSVAISIVDLSGKTVYLMNAVLSSGTHSFLVSGIRHGMYFVKVTGKNYFYSTKLISQSKPECAAKIEYVPSGQINQSKQLKSTAATIDMQYTNGDQLLYKGISGIYSTIVTDVPTSSKTTTFNFVACTDADNNSYPVVTIGTQTWMAENLKVTHYRNGDEIPNVTDESQWGGLTTGAYCWYNNDISWKDAYGALCNWYVVVDSRELCPAGWHTPSDAEWTILTNYLGGEDEAGGKMKSTRKEPDADPRWNSPNTRATNESGFSGLPGGYRDYDGPFATLGTTGYFWSSSEGSSYYAWLRNLYYDYSNVFSYYDAKRNGFSVRCLQDY